MSNVLISFLGTGPTEPITGKQKRAYRKAKYSVNGELVGESSFMFSVLMEHFDIENLILVGTAKSMWEEVYLHFCEQNQEIENEDIYLQLAESVQLASYKTEPESIDLEPIRKLMTPKSELITIPYGLNRHEQLNIFSRLGKAFEKLESGDEVYLDITHSFRSLPLFATTVLRYFQSLTNKDIRLKKVYYGMIDAMREFDNVAPIIDVSATLELQEWTTAAHSFKEYGKGSMLADLLGGDAGKTIQIFSDAVNINYLNEIKVKLTNFQSLAESDFQQEFAKWVVPDVLKSFTQRLQKTGNSQWRFQYELSVWHREKQNYGSAYVVFVESIITFVCEHKKLNWANYEHREAAKDFLKGDYLNLKEIYLSARAPRNKVAHQINERKNSVAADIQSLEKLQKEFLKIT